MAEDDQFPAPNYEPIKPVSGQTVAVAIKGEIGKPDSLPKVIASGRGQNAEEILRLAFEKGLRVRQDADLAEILARLDLDTPIPSEAIIAVAEILARVYAANGRMIKPVPHKLP